MKFVLRDAMHEMEGTVEAKGRAVFPGLDVVSWGSHCPAIGRQPPAARCCLVSHRGLMTVYMAAGGGPSPSSRATCRDLSREP